MRRLIYSSLAVLCLSIGIFGQPPAAPQIEVDGTHPHVWVLGTAAGAPAERYPGLRVVVVDTPARCFYVIQGQYVETPFVVRAVPKVELPIGKGCQ